MKQAVDVPAVVELTFWLERQTIKRDQRYNVLCLRTRWARCYFIHREQRLGLVHRSRRVPNS